MKSEGRFESIFNHVNEGILIANAKGEIVLVNPRMTQLFGYKSEEVLGKPVEILIPGEFRHGHEAHREKYMEQPQRRPMGKNITLYGLKKDQSKFPLEISLSYYKSADEFYVIAFLIDITERFEQQEKIRKFNEALRQLNENLEKKVNERTLVLKEALTELEISRDDLADALEKEKELNEMKSRFISMASHEFRTPLSTILSSVSLISKYTTGEEQDKRDKHINRIKTAVHSLTEILNDFLSIGKLEEGKIYANIAEFDFCQVCEEVIAEMQAIAQEGQRISFHHSGGCIVKLDKQMLRNVLINLLANAIKFSPSGKPIEVVIDNNDDRISMEIRDHGIGIPEDEQVYLFDRFFRARNASNIQGTGLGLHIVKKYLELMNGEIDFRSISGEGTTFFIHFKNNNQVS